MRAGLRLVDEIDALPGIGDQALEVRVGVNTGEALVRLDLDPASGEASSVSGGSGCDASSDYGWVGGTYHTP